MATKLALDPFMLAAEMLNPHQTQDEIDHGLMPWRECRRPNQCPPTEPADWYLWLILAGRGWGKTRTGAEFMLDEMVAFPRYWYAMIGPTFDEGRDIMVEGESGLLACADARKIRYDWNKQLGHFKIKGGAQCDLFSAEKPDGIRGPNLRVLWGDEPASWRYGQEVWNTVQFAMRKGDVKAIITGTPKATPFIKFLIGEADVITKGHSDENKANLSEKYYSRVIKPYENTRLGRQELNAEVLEDVEGALWTQAQIDADRVWKVPSHREFEGQEFYDVADLAKILAAVDPSVTSKGARNSVTGRAQRTSDEVGIIGIALGENEHGYVLADWSGIYTPDQWCGRTLDLYDRYDMDEIVAEVNMGYDLVESTLRGVCRSTGRPMPKLIKCHASRGKTVRAGPVTALYDQHVMHHVGVLPELEDEMTSWVGNVPGARSPNRIDGLVYGASELMLRPKGRQLGYTVTQ